MIHETIPIQNPGSQEYARLVTYFQDYREELAVRKRPLVLVCPGGGYAYTSARESEPLALAFLAMGYHAAILHYSVAPARYPVALSELASAVKLLRAHAKEWHIDESAIVVQGCSAGGHLAASYACFWRTEAACAEAQIPERTVSGRALGTPEDAPGGEAAEVLRPNGLLLCYPVITGGKYAHRGSFENLLGEQAGREGTPECEAQSLEKCVSADVPPTFLWHTFTDGSVPVQNSLYFAEALKEAEVPTELHIYPVGGHGLALADERTLGRSGKENFPECQSWIRLARKWLNLYFPLTMELDPR